MKYLQGNFTLPASSNTSQKRWDFAFLDKEEFKRKYSVNDEEYQKLVKEM